MPVIIRHRSIAGDVASAHAHSETLVSALQRLRDGETSTAEELKAVPPLGLYTVGTLTSPCLLRNAAYCRKGGNAGCSILTSPTLSQAIRGRR